MLETLHRIYKIKATSTLNGVLYFLKKIPFIKNLVRDTTYTFPRLKGALGIVSIIINIFKTFTGTLVVYLIFFLPSVFVAGENVQLPLATLMFFFYYLIRLINSEILQYDLNKFIMVRQMRMNPRNYALASLLHQEGLKFLFKAFLFSLLLPFDIPLVGIFLALSISAFALFTEGLHLFLYDRFGFNIAKKNTQVTVLTIVILIIAYPLAFISPFPIFLTILTSPWFLISTILSGISGAFMILRFDRYSQAISETNNLENLAVMRSAMSEARTRDIQVREKDYKNKDLRLAEGSSQKEGYAYLNDTFFKRHRRMVYRPLLIKSAVILVIILAIFIGTEYFAPEAGPEISMVFYEQFTLFVFLMYLLCNTEKITRSMFYNCDLSLLRYGFYKKGDALLKMFSIRLKTIAAYNLIPTTLLAAGVTFIMFRYTDLDPVKVLPIILMLYALALFFSVHYLFLYYIFQPFTSAMEIKNPFYSLINIGVYIFSWGIMQIPAPPALFFPIIIVLLIVYTVAALALVYRKAPSTFKIK